MSKGKLIVKKTKATVSNTLNEMFFEQKDMTLQAFRMLMFYLAKIDPRNPDKTEIQVPLAEYAKMIGVELNEDAIDKSTTMLLGYVVNIEPKDDGEFEELNNKVQVFSQSKLKRRKKDGVLFLTFKCHDELKPHIFNLQSQFTKFEVWNILNLGNFQDIRMYMLLSQYRVAGERTIEISELKEKLGISKESYQEYKIFSRDVLKKCQKALRERTDLSFEFKAVGRPAHSIYFTIHKNDGYNILKYLEDPNPVQLPTPQPETATERDQREDICSGFEEDIFAEFTLEQLQELRNLALPMIDHNEIDRYDTLLHNQPMAIQYATSEYVKRKILLCNASTKTIHSRYAFIKSAVSEDWR